MDKELVKIVEEKYHALEPFLTEPVFVNIDVALTLNHSLSFLRPEAPFLNANALRLLATQFVK